MNKGTYSRPVSFLICFLVYVVAFAIADGFVFYFEERIDRLWVIFWADVVATVLVFTFSVGFRNSSLYDPYWSVAPPLIAVFWLVTGTISLTGYLMLITILFWSVRLTFNWCRGWRGLSHEDWRYIMLREKNPVLYPLINLTGIHLFPTIMVFLGMLPVYVVTTIDTGVSVHNPLLVIGLFITFASTIIALIADEQMRQFRNQAKKDEYIKTGLWKYSRHPNYFGEISFWFGLWVMQMAVAPQFWWTIIGFISMTLMFLLASIPMMEAKNRKSKTGYDNYMNQVSRLIPWPTKKDF